MVKVGHDKNGINQITFTLNSSKNERITTGYSKTYFNRIAKAFNEAVPGESFERSFKFSTDAITKKKFEGYLETQVSEYISRKVFLKS